MFAIFNIDLGCSEAFLGAWPSFQYHFDTDGFCNNENNNEILFINNQIASSYVNLNDIRQVI